MYVAMIIGYVIVWFFFYFVGMALGAGFGVAHRIFGPRPTPTAPTEEPTPPTRKHRPCCTVPPASAAPTPTPLCYAPPPRTAPAPPPPSTPVQPVRPLLRLQPRARGGGACIAHHKAFIDVCCFSACFCLSSFILYRN